MAIRQAVAVLNRRLTSISSRLHALRSGADQITIAGVSPSGRAQVLALTRPGRLLFYDWEADALTSDGKTVASQLTARSPDALRISQGEDSGPGSPDGGGVSLYQAVKLASTQPVVQAGGSRQLSREGAQYYLFGAPGSAACAAVAKHDMTAPIPGEHCLLAGPCARVSDLQADLPPGTTMADGDRLTVRQGTVVMQAANPTATDQISFDSPLARFYVLKDNVALTGNQVTDPHQSTDQSGRIDVAFNFTAEGNSQFQRLTAQIAHRGQIYSAAEIDARPTLRSRPGHPADHRRLNRLQGLSRRDHRRKRSRRHRSLHNPHRTRDISNPARWRARDLPHPATMTTATCGVEIGEARSSRKAEAAEQSTA